MYDDGAEVAVRQEEIPRSRVQRPTFARDLTIVETKVDRERKKKKKMENGLDDGVRVDETDEDTDGEDLDGMDRLNDLDAESSSDEERNARRPKNSSKNGNKRGQKG